MLIIGYSDKTSMLPLGLCQQGERVCVVSGGFLSLSHGLSLSLSLSLSHEHKHTHTHIHTHTRTLFSSCCNSRIAFSDDSFLLTHIHTNRSVPLTTAPTAPHTQTNTHIT